MLGRLKPVNNYTHVVGLSAVVKPGTFRGNFNDIIERGAELRNFNTVTVVGEQIRPNFFNVASSFSNEVFDTFLSHISAHEIRHLDLSNIELSNQNALSLRSFLHGNAVLESLSITVGNPSLTPVGISSILVGLEYNSSIQEFTVTGPNVEREYWGISLMYQLGNVIKQNKSLQFIKLENIQIDDGEDLLPLLNSYKEAENPDLTITGLGCRLRNIGSINHSTVSLLENWALDDSYSARLNR